MTQRIPLTVGDPFGRGRVLDPDVRRDNGVIVLLLCDPALGGCGATYEARASNLRAGHSLSCGCLRREGGRPAHGLTRHPLYPLWSAMISRCENPRNKRYAQYGGRGITVCLEWHDPARFVADVEAEIGPRPPGRTPGGMSLWTLDRRDNDGNYELGNIRWATWLQQRRNRRPGRHVGHPISEETKAKIGRANSGKTRSAETRRKMSESHIRRGCPPGCQCGRHASGSARRRNERGQFA